MELWPANHERQWRLITDTVMGGVSRGMLTPETIAGREAMQMSGNVSTENNGGFIQIALDIARDGQAFDADGFTGIEFDIFGNGEAYAVNLRTTELTRPQQSYRRAIIAPRNWITLQLPFSEFTPHRTELSLDPAKLRRIGLIAFGREFHADLAVARLGIY